jgi:hypothetical protein
MRKLLICTAVMALAAPAFADTLKEMTTKGAVYSIQGMEIDVTFKPDGTFTGMDGQLNGKWRIDGEKLCTSSNFAETEECLVFPKDKKSGDSFEITGALGPATVKIK